MAMSSFMNTRRRIRQAGQGMSEYIIIAASIAIGAIGVFTQFGSVNRHQVAAAAQALAGLNGSDQTAAAQERATAAAQEANTDKGMGNFSSSNGSGGGSDSGTNGSNSNPGNNPGNNDNGGNGGNDGNGSVDVSGNPPSCGDAS